VLSSVFAKTLRDCRAALPGGASASREWSRSWCHLSNGARQPALDKLAKLPRCAEGILGFGGELDYSSAAGYLGIELFSLMVRCCCSSRRSARARMRSRGGARHPRSASLAPISSPRPAPSSGSFAEAAGLGIVLWVSLVIGARHRNGHRGGTARRGDDAGRPSGVVFGAVALFVGSATGRRSRAIGL
jgi:hypothetical protein